LAYAVMNASPPFQWREKPFDKSTERRRTVKSVGLGRWGVVCMRTALKMIQNMRIVQF
jgi:nicotinamide riboside transporter PnuC